MHQAAALPFRRTRGDDQERIEVLLINSSSNRWIIPKGDIDGGMEPHLAAEKEAFEEGGVQGRIGAIALGTFCFRKEQGGTTIAVEVAVFPLEVTRELENWPEMDRRRRRWLPVAEAAEAVGDAGLAEIIRDFSCRTR